MPQKSVQVRDDETRQWDSESVRRAAANRAELVRAAHLSADQLAAVDRVVADMNTRLLALHDAAPFPDEDPAVERRASLERTVETFQIVLDAETDLYALVSDAQRQAVPVEVLDPSTWITPALAAEVE